MPTRLYQPIRSKAATAPDHVMAHEWKFSLVAGLWTTLGLLLCWTWIDPGGGPITVISDLSQWAAGAIAVSLLVCGLAVLVSILWRGDDRTALRIELPALTLGAFAWIAYATVSPSMFWRAIAFWFVIGCALRWIDAVKLLRGAAEPNGDVIAIARD